MEIARKVTYPITYSEDYIQDAIFNSSVKLASWLSTKDPNSVVIAPILVGGRFFTDHLLRHIQYSYDIMPIVAKSYTGKSRQSGWIVKPEGFDELSNINVVIIDAICDSGNTLADVKKLFLKVSADIFTMVLLDRQLPNRICIPDVSAIQDNTPAWWVGCGLEDPAGQHAGLPYLIGLEPGKEF